MDVADEVEAVQSIFLEDLHCSEEGGRTRVLDFSFEKQHVLKLKIGEDYPNQLPEISVPTHLQSLGLREHIVEVCSDSAGSPMLFQMLTAAKDWVSGHLFSIKPTVVGLPNQSATVALSTTSTVCKFYLQGKCKFGDKCRNLHAKKSGHSPSKTSGSPSPTKNTVPLADKGDGGNRQKKGRGQGSDTRESETGVKSKKTKATREASDLEENSKKLPMRQATDVISRILWDPDLPSEEFTVGYLDRFLGVMEKPFSAFSWEDIASVGMNVLAVPKHRIQYFKYQNEIVWDKTSQLDNFFGSRGGKVISEIVAKHSPEVDQEDKARSIQTEDRDVGLDEEMGEGREELLEVQESVAAPSFVADKNRPNHFICIHITDDTVKAKVQQIQDHITGHTPQLTEGCLPITALHVTLCMLRIDSDQQAETVKSILQNVAKQFIHILPPCVKLTFTGVSNFRERLVYIRVAPNPALSRFVLYLLDQLHQGGIRTPGNHEQYTPHMTIVKLSRPLQRELHTTLISPATYRPFEDAHIGTQCVDAVYTCSMTAPKQDDGFYLRLTSVFNSLSGLSPLVPSLVLNRLESMASAGIITEHEKDLLAQGIHSSKSGASQRFDAVVRELLQLNSDETMCSMCELVSETVVVILRGLPGSGKSFVARNCIEFLGSPTSTTICGADGYFMEGDSYKFNADLLPKAHSYCLEQFLNALSDHKSLVIIDNTNSMLWEYQIYCYLCEILGCKYHVLELPCPSVAIAEMYCKRNVHSIDPPTAMKIYNRWEEDERAALIPPSLGFPQTRQSSSPSQFFLSELCDPTSTPISALSSYQSLKVVYTAVFLTLESQWLLVSAFTPTHPRVFASHVTLCFDPSSVDIAKTGIGHHVVVKVTGSVDSSKVQAVTVHLPKGVCSSNECPHITISTEEGVSAKVTNSMLKSHPAKSSSHTQSLQLEGIIGVVVRETNERDIALKTLATEGTPDPATADQPCYTITSNSDFHHHVLPKLYGSLVDQQSEVESLVPSPSMAQICTGYHNITQLFVFDFDGTLFEAPEPREGKEFYEKITGKQWPHKGWLSWPESLLPPIKVRPGPALPEFQQHLSRAGSLTIILTGRVARVESALRSVLENNQVFPQRTYLKPTSANESTPHFKARIVKQLLEEFPEISLVKFWDDIPDNLAAIQRLSRNVRGDVQFEIIDATKMLPTTASKQGKKLLRIKPSHQISTPVNSVLESYLVSFGRLPVTAYKSAVMAGTEFLASQFCNAIDVPSSNAANLVYPFGSFPLGRCSDVDLCFLAPSSLSPKDCMDKLAPQLESCGVSFVHAAYSTRCPRLKVILEFSDCPAVTYDIVFASVTASDIFSSSPSSKLPASMLLSTLKPGDTASKVAFMGPVFLEEVQHSLEGFVSMPQFGAVVEMMAYTLTSHRQKGNAYHCMRTFHIVNLLANFVKSRRGDLPKKPTCDDLFQAFVTYTSTLKESKLQELFGEFVPQEFIPRILKLFSRLNKEVAFDDYPSVTCFEELTDRPSFPPEGYTLVELELSGTDQVLLWKLSTIIEARLPTYIRQLLKMGIDVIPDGNPANERKFCFAVPHSKSSKQTLQQVLRPFWNELVKYRKQGDVHVELTFGLGTDGRAASGKSDVVSQTATPGGALVEQVMQFAAGASGKELHLPPSLSSYDRLLVHETAEQLRLKHATVGTGKQKHIVLRK